MLKQVVNIKFLGVLLSRRGEQRVEMEFVIESAAKPYHSLLTHLWTNRNCQHWSI